MQSTHFVKRFLIGNQFKGEGRLCQLHFDWTTVITPPRTLIASTNFMPKRIFCALLTVSASETLISYDGIDKETCSTWISMVIILFLLCEPKCLPCHFYILAIKCGWGTVSTNYSFRLIVVCVFGAILFRYFYA